jgi:glucosamine--fructose-6-phosphate aminotransferase (isomerizing)
MTLHSEIHEQPDVIERALQGGDEPIRRAAAALRKAAYTVIAARGTSDNAARYAKYVWEAHNRIPVSLAAPSVFSVYRTPPNLHGALVVGLSQSGRSPDIVAVVAEGARQGCPTVAVTNDLDSPLARAAGVVVDIGAGAEAAVAATKTYTGELLAIARISAAAGGEPPVDGLDRLPDWIRAVLALDGPILAAAQRYRDAERCVVLGRGYNYATAFEWSLKLKELAYVAAEPYSPADFRHGPIALVADGFPALAVAPSGAVFEDMLDLIVRLKSRHRARLVVISDEPRALALADDPIPLPRGIPEWLSPLVAIVPAQLFCFHLTRAKGHDPDNPRSIQKVTLTQ